MLLLVGLALLIGAPVCADASMEQRPLGVPNAVDADDAADETSSALSSLDPRRNGAVRVVAALGVVIGLIVLLRAVLRASAPTLGVGGRSGGALEVLARYPVGKGQQMLVLAFAGRVVLIHQAGTNVTTLSEITDPAEVEQLHARLDKRQSWPVVENEGEVVVDLTRRAGRSS